MVGYSNVRGSESVKKLVLLLLRREVQPYCTVSPGIEKGSTHVMDPSSGES